MLKPLGRPNPYDVRQMLWLLEELGLPFKQDAWGRGHRPTSEPPFLCRSTRSARFRCWWMGRWCCENRM